MTERDRQEIEQFERVGRARREHEQRGWRRGMAHAAQIAGDMGDPHIEEEIRARLALQSDAKTGDET